MIPEKDWKQITCTDHWTTESGIAPTVIGDKLILTGKTKSGFRVWIHQIKVQKFFDDCGCPKCYSDKSKIYRDCIEEKSVALSVHRNACREVAGIAKSTTQIEPETDDDLTPIPVAVPNGLDIYRSVEDSQDYLIFESSTQELINTVSFQNGPINDKGINGLQIETLLTICVDRLNEWQHGSCPCEANDKAIIAIEDALRVLNVRTLDRRERGVEGKEIA